MIFQQLLFLFLLLIRKRCHESRVPHLRREIVDLDQAAQRLVQNKCNVVHEHVDKLYKEVGVDSSLLS